jgi:hypothetical protein
MSALDLGSLTQQFSRTTIISIPPAVIFNSARRIRQKCVLHQVYQGWPTPGLGTDPSSRAVVPQRLATPTMGLSPAGGDGGGIGGAMSVTPCGEPCDGDVVVA